MAAQNPTPTLNPFTVFPFKIDPIPQDWLRQFAGFQPIAASADDRSPIDAQHFED